MCVAGFAYRLLRFWGEYQIQVLNDARGFMLIHRGSAIFILLGINEGALFGIRNVFQAGA